MQKKNGSVNIVLGIALMMYWIAGCATAIESTKVSSAKAQTDGANSTDSVEGGMAPGDAVERKTESQSADSVPPKNTDEEDGEAQLLTPTAESESGLVSPLTVRFEWCPKARAADSYDLPEEADQHRIVFPKGLVKGKSYPVVVAFHGQPKRGKNPRDYSFMEPVQQQVLKMVDEKDIQPVILVMPAFRYFGSNWPWFQPKKFKDEVVQKLEAAGFGATAWYAFGHSGAAGCGGGGLNQIHLMNPAGVGFFDTCLGDGWQKEIAALQKAKVATFNIHSVETAGFKPKQHPEYQADFDFGRAYSPLGIDPVECPGQHPGKKLRTLKHRCSATKDGVVKSFVIDTGEGVEAHKAILEPAISFFLKYFLQ